MVSVVAQHLPAIPDLQAGLNFLSRLPVANPVQALPALQQLYGSLIRYPLPAKPMLQLLEHSRAPLATILEVHARRYLNHPVPLGEVEEKAFAETCAAWQLAAKVYARCAQVDSGDDAEHADRIATILHRCITYTGLAMHEHFRARRELPPELWLELYGYYASAEEWDIAQHPVRDPLAGPQRSTHCAAALVTVLLADLAGPYSLGLKQVDLMRRWAAAWSTLVEVTPARLDDPQTRFVVDLMQASGLMFAPDLTPSEDQRGLDTSRLTQQIKEVRVQLKHRTSPAALGLGEDVGSGQAQALLALLARAWRQTDVPRRFRRRAASGSARIASGFEAIHYLVSGSEFRQPENVRQYSRTEFEALYVFRHRENPHQALHVKRQDFNYPIDHWQVLNQSPTGFRLERRPGGQKLTHGQLIAVQPPDGDRFLLAQTHWLMQNRQSGLVAGVGVLPGTPLAIAVRATGANVSFTEPYCRAFLLPEVTAMETPTSLVLPQGWFYTGRIIEVQTDIVWQAKLTGLIEQGVDFDRVSYVLCG